MLFCFYFSKNLHKLLDFCNIILNDFRDFIKRGICQKKETQNAEKTEMEREVGSRDRPKELETVNGNSPCLSSLFVRMSELFAPLQISAALKPI